MVRHVFVCVFSRSDLSEQIKAVTKDSHVRAENTELMLSYQRGHVSLRQYQVNAQSSLGESFMCSFVIRPHLKCSFVLSDASVFSL